MGAVIPFAFEAHRVRVLDRDDAPWFVAADVCAALGLTNSRDAVAKLDNDEKGVGSTDTLGGAQQATIINEGGLYTLVLRCRDAMTPGTVAWRFRKWVTAEVLPALRRRGRYHLAPTDDPPPFDPALMTAANGLVRTAMRLGGVRAGRVVWDRLGLPAFASTSVLSVSSDRLVTMIRAAGEDGLTGNELARRAQWISADDRAALLDQLIAAGHVSCEVQHRAEGGRPRRIYRAGG